MRVIFPPRPRGKLEPRLLPAEEKRDHWVAQWKYNGARTTVAVDPDGVVRLYNRFGKGHTKYTLDASMRSQILSLNMERGKGYVLDGELMDSKTSLKRTIVLYDVLWEDRYLLFVNQMDRLDALRRICRDPATFAPCGVALRVTDNVWMAPTFHGDFPSRYQEAVPNEHLEGLVLRSKNASLDNSGYKEYEVPWLLRCRKPAKISGTF